MTFLLLYANLYELTPFTARTLLGPGTNAGMQNAS